MHAITESLPDNLADISEPRLQKYQGDSVINKVSRKKDSNSDPVTYRRPTFTEEEVEDNFVKKMMKRRETNADALRKRRSTLTLEEKEHARLKNTASRRRHRALLSSEGNATVRAKDIASKLGMITMTQR